MKKNDQQELFAKSIPELKKEVEKTNKELIEAKFKFSKGQLNDVRLPSKLRNKIAVIKTIISQKEIQNE